MGPLINFSEALEYLKDGGRVSRDGWNGRGMWAQLQYPDTNSKMTRPYLYLKAVDGSIGPWLPSQTDLLADDWNLHPKE